MLKHTNCSIGPVDMTLIQPLLLYTACNPLTPSFQLIYDYKDRGASVGLISLHPEKLPELEKETFRKIGIKIPSMA